MFDAIIGIELIKLLCKNDLFSMVEVLHFAATRHLFIDHLKPLDMLLGVAAIAVLFAVRKFLLLHLEVHEKKPEEKESAHDKGLKEKIMGEKAKLFPLAKFRK